MQDTLAARSRRGEAKLFDPTNSTGLPTAAWSPIAASTSWRAARRTAAGILLIREKDAFAEKLPLGLTVARVKLLDSRIPNLERHGFDRNFNVHSEMYAAYFFVVHPDVHMRRVGGCDFVFHQGSIEGLVGRVSFRIPIGFQFETFLPCPAHNVQNADVK